MNDDEPTVDSKVPRIVAALVGLLVGVVLLALAAFDPLGFRGNFLTVLSTLVGAGCVLGGIALLAPRVAGLLVDLILAVISHH